MLDVLQGMRCKPKEESERSPIFFFLLFTQNVSIFKTNQFGEQYLLLLLSFYITERNQNELIKSI
jgi:hypothetical protein